MSLPVLLIGFNRPELIAAQLQLLGDLGIKKIYVSIDGGRSDIEQAVCNKTAQVVRDFKFNGQSFLRARDYNLGCGLGVISALDWFFSMESVGIVLEDDCVPTLETMQYFLENQERLFNENDLGMISAHNPCQISESNIYSTYIFINGWMSTSEKYSKIRKNLFGFSLPFKTKIPGGRWKLSDAVFWWSTSTRVKLGSHDTWDSPFLENFAQLGFRSLIPSKNLIENVGFGVSASHTKDENGTIFIPSEVLPNEINQSNFDSLVRKFHFGIKARHSITPFGKVLRDFIVATRKNFEEILRIDRENLALSRAEIHQ